MALIALIGTDGALSVRVSARQCASVKLRQYELSVLSVPADEGIGMVYCLFTARTPKTIHGKLGCIVVN